MVFNCLHFLILWNSFILTIPEWSLLIWDFWKTRTFWKRSQYFDWTQLDIGLHENKEARRWVILIPAVQVWSCYLVGPFYPDLGNTLGGGGAELPWPWGLLSDSLCFLLVSSYLFVVNNEHSSSAPGMALLFSTLRPGIPVHRVGDAIQPSHPLSSPSPPAPNPSQHQGLFQWVNSLHEVAKVLEFQLQHQSFQWIPRTDLL